MHHWRSTTRREHAGGTPTVAFEGRNKEHRRAVGTYDFPYADIDARNGWREQGEAEADAAEEARAQEREQSGIVSIVAWLWITSQVKCVPGLPAW